MDLNHTSGGIVEGWASVVQSMQTILSTRINTRPFLRQFGSEVPELIDAPLNEISLMELYVAVAEALAQWEPRFELTEVQLQAGADGAVVLQLTGAHRPNAHMGDLAIANDETKAVRLQRDGADTWSLAA